MPLPTIRPALRPLALLAALAACAPSSPSQPIAAGQGVAVVVTPGQADVAPLATTRFAAAVTGTANVAVDWSVRESGGGTIDAGGLYTAPAGAGTFHVVATSAAVPSASASAAVTVVAPPAPVTVTISPASGAVNSCQSLTFSASVSGTTDTVVTWSVQEGAAGGTIASNGAYTAPASAGTYHVVATSHADPSSSATVPVAVTDRILSVAVAPQAVSVAPGGTAQFTATVTTTCGSYPSTAAVAANGAIRVLR